MHTALLPRIALLSHPPPTRFIIPLNLTAMKIPVMGQETGKTMSHQKPKEAICPILNHSQRRHQIKEDVTARRIKPIDIKTQANVKFIFMASHCLKIKSRIC